VAAVHDLELHLEGWSADYIGGLANLSEVVVCARFEARAEEALYTFDIEEVELSLLEAGERFEGPSELGGGLGLGLGTDPADPDGGGFGGELEVLVVEVVLDLHTGSSAFLPDLSSLLQNLLNDVLFVHSTIYL
jgi:hypothetical protein